MKKKLLQRTLLGMICLNFLCLSAAHANKVSHSKTLNSFNFYPTNLSGFDYVHGSGPSATQSFEINDVLALERAYTISASVGYEVSLEPNNNFSSVLIIPNTTIDSGPVDVYIRLTVNMPVGTYSGSIHVFAPDPSETRQRPSNVVDETIAVEGEVSRKQTVWNGTAWSNGIPDIETIAIISGDYSTSLHTDLSAWNLTIDSGKTLTVDNNTFVKVKTDVVVNGQVIVETKGAFVQVENSGTFTLNTGGFTTVNKTTSQLVNWYDYTYWSSPVSNTTASQAFVNSNRKYWYDAQNFLDILMETNNGNTYVSGHDDVDDNGDDWAVVSGTDVLVPGMGYATTQNSSGFVSGSTHDYHFDGPLNTGTITTPIYFNGDNGDSDWNFIGNPYPCAIDVDAFFAANSSVIAGAVYLWSHASLPDSENNGNEVYNFNSDDYAIINAGSGEIAGGKPIIPNRYIPSGQGFFVQGLTNGSVVFNNSMRVADNSSNSHFFRTEDQANKLWLSLTSDNGAFNQVLVAYVSEATNGNDGLMYDTPRNLSSEAAAIIYTFIDSEPDKLYAIQGKAENSLAVDEVIPVGFYTTIDEATLYTFTLSQFQGEFLNVQTVYLKDKYQNVIHNLNESDYVFTSLAGTFNDRFEIVFQNNTLSINQNTLENQISIIELGPQDFKFKTSLNQPITVIDLYDVQGRKIYTLDGFEGSKSYHLPALSKATYVATFTLEDNTVVTKKMISRF